MDPHLSQKGNNEKQWIIKKNNLCMKEFKKKLNNPHI